MWERRNITSSEGGEKYHTCNKKSKVNWIGHILRRNCLLKHVIAGKIEGGIEVTERRGGRRKQLLNGLQKNIKYWKLKEAALDRIVWRNRFGRSYGPSVRHEGLISVCVFVALLI